MEIYLAKTQGFCAGVSFAIDIVERTLKKYGKPLYVYHEIVHNTHVVEGFRNKSVIFIEDLNEVPEGSRIIFSAHGMPPPVIEKAKNRKLKFIDATCPLVTKVHNEAIRFSHLRYKTILLGHRGHQEIIGTAGYVDSRLLHIVETSEDIDHLDSDPHSKVAYISQTTLSSDDTKDMVAKLKKKLPNLISPPRSDLCYATQNRQDAVKELAAFCDVIIICGSPNSSNSNRLRETGERAGCPSYLIDTADELNFNIIAGKEKIGISSGASVPCLIVDQLIVKITKKYPGTVVRTFDNPERNIVFALPQI